MSLTTDAEISASESMVSILSGGPLPPSWASKGLMIPTDFGGLGQSAVEAALAVEGLSWAVPELGSGTSIGCFAMSDTGAITTIATPLYVERPQRDRGSEQ